jgi:hypothetical protein
MGSLRNPWAAGLTLVVTGALATLGCYNTPVDTSEYAQGPAPRRMPSPGKEAEACGCYEDSLTGGQVFSMYCSSCHNAPALAERPFSNFQNVAAHMRVRANLTGKEYAKLVEFLRRWHDVPPPTPPPAPSPKRFVYAQPIAELREQSTPPQSLGNPGLAPADVRNTPAPPAAQDPAVVPARGSGPPDAPQP